MQHSRYSPVNVLFVSANERDRTALSHIFSQSRWQLETAESLKELQTRLGTCFHGVVMCDSALPDATWREVWDRLDKHDEHPLLVVTCNDADDSLWAEVLNRGAYDILEKPFDPSEVFRVISLAWRHSVDRRKQIDAATPSELAAAAVQGH